MKQLFASEMSALLLYPPILKYYIMFLTQPKSNSFTKLKTDSQTL